MSLPASVSVDRPLKLGNTFLGTGGEEGYYNLKLDFQPESLQQAQQADLLLLGEDKVCGALWHHQAVHGHPVVQSLRV